MSVRKNVLAIIQKNKLQTFKICDIKELAREVVEAKTETQLGLKVYKAVWALKQQGLLSVEKSSENPQDNIYHLTNAGMEDCSVVSTSILKERSAPTREKSSYEILRRKQSDYSSALALSSIQAQEYQELSRELSKDMYDVIQKHYIAAKEQAVMYQAKLAAVESLLEGAC